MQQDRIEKLVATKDDILDVNLEGTLALASPLPYAYEAGVGRIVSVPNRDEWDAFEAGPRSVDDPRWLTLRDSTVAFATPAADEDGQGDRDARYLVQAANAVPRLLRRIRELETALGITPPASSPAGHLDVCRG